MAINDIRDFVELNPNGVGLDDLPLLNAIDPDDHFSSLNSFAHQLVEDVACNDEAFARFVAATQEQVEADAAKFDTEVPAARRATINKLLALILATSPEAYRLVTPFATALGSINDTVFQGVIEAYTAEYERQVAQAQDPTEITCQDDILCNLIQALGMHMQQLMGDLSENMRPCTPEELLWYARFRNCYIRWLHTVDAQSWYEVGDPQYSLRDFLDMVLLHTLMDPFLRVINAELNAKD